MKNLFATKSVDELRADAEHGGGFKRTLGALDLTLLGIGCIIGTGIFVLTGRAAAANAQFQSVAQQYGMTQSGKLALYFTGLTYMEEGQNGPAEDAFKKTAGSWSSDLAALGKFSLAQLYEQTGRDPQAVDLFNELSNGKASTVPPGLAQIQLAELYSAEGKPDKAKEVYAKLKDKDKDAKGNPGVAGSIAAEKLNPQPAGQQ